MHFQLRKHKVPQVGEWNTDSQAEPIHLLAELPLNEKLEEEQAPLAASTRQYKSAEAHKTDKWIFDRNIIGESKSRRQPNSEIHWLADLLEK